ncbi:MAG: radical SAM protein [Candidatus Portnoybacteria bacterium]|nr:radical SAM protein [Candidatus Portnoybacteria bacterium]MDD4982847.1 radical SAM protein [Candidatus Portnoybacteria bacterium]
MKKAKNNPFSIYTHNINWVITDTCNYRCPYCFASVKKEPSSVSPLAIVEGLKNKLKGKWDVTILGGEPFFHDDFLEAIKGLTKLKQLHRISIYTNFSAKSDKIVKFLKITKGRLFLVFASLHLDYVKSDAFLSKVSEIEKSFPGFKKNLLVTSVGIVDKLPYLEKIKKKFFEAGVQLIIWAYQRPDRTFFQYSARQKKILKQLNQNYNLPRFNDFAAACSNQGIDKPSASFKGRKCSAGFWSFFMLPNGAAYSCVMACRAKKGYLGNLLKGDFELRKTFSQCLYEECSCSLSVDRIFWDKAVIKSK